MINEKFLAELFLFFIKNNDIIFAGDFMRVNSIEVKRILEEIKPAKLVAATKYVWVKEINELETLGCLVYGENRVQAFLDKYEKYQGKGSWHFIGTLQTNKVKYIIDKVDLIHSVNTLGLIKEIEK